MNCTVCKETANRLFGGKCNKCLCREAVEDAFMEEAGEGNPALLSEVNTPITPFDYVEIVQNNAQIDWKSYIK